MSSIEAVKSFIKNEIKLTKEFDGAILITLKSGGNCDVSQVGDINKLESHFMMNQLQAVIIGLSMQEMGLVKKP